MLNALRFLGFLIMCGASYLIFQIAWIDHPEMTYRILLREYPFYFAWVFILYFGGWILLTQLRGSKRRRRK